MAAVTKDMTLRTVHAQAVADALDGGSLKLYTSGGATLRATFTLSSAVTAASGTFDFATMTTVQAVNSGAIAEAVWETSGAQATLTGTVTGTGGGGALEITNTDPTAGDDIENTTAISYTENA